MSSSVVARVAAAFLALGLLLFIDMGTKSWAAGELRARGPRTVAGGHLRFKYSENSGIIFGRLRDGARQSAIIVYSAATAAALFGVLLHRLLRQRPPGFVLPAGCVALLAGTLGNLHDRLERGFVVDFIDFQPVNWPSFNVADMAIGVGIGLCLVAIGRAALRLRRTPALA